MASLLLGLLSLQIYFAHGQYKIGSYNHKITNPTNKKSVNLIIHFPETTAKNYQFPVVVFNHGAKCHNTWYNYVWQDLVPLGYIVAMPGDDEGSVADETIKEYAAGQRATLDYLRSQCNGDKTCKIYGQVANKSVAMGHSMGGGASLLSLSNDNLGAKFEYEFDAGFTYCGCYQKNNDVFNAVPNIKKPLFLMTANHDCICPPNEYSERYYKEIANNAACKYLGDIANGDHCNFEDTVNIIQCQNLENSKCPKDKNDISPKQQQIIAIKYTKVFLNGTLYHNNNKTYFSQITNMLNHDKIDGTMSDVEIGNQC